MLSAFIYLYTYFGFDKCFLIKLPTTNEAVNEYAKSR